MVPILINCDIHVYIYVDNDVTLIFKGYEGICQERPWWTSSPIRQLPDTCLLYAVSYVKHIVSLGFGSHYGFNQAGVIIMIALFCIVCASWTGLFSHIGYACQMTQATSINDNLINKCGTFDDLMELNHR